MSSSMVLDELAGMVVSDLDGRLGDVGIVARNRHSVRLDCPSGLMGERIRDFTIYLSGDDGCGVFCTLREEDVEGGRDPGLYVAAKNRKGELDRVLGQLGGGPRMTSSFEVKKEDGRRRWKITIRWSGDGRVAAERPRQAKRMAAAFEMLADFLLAVRDDHPWEAASVQAGDDGTTAVEPMRSSSPGTVLDPVEAEVMEGRQDLREHLVRERSAKLVRWFKAWLSDVRCEVCGFDFGRWYGALGDGFIEAHHEAPIGLREGAGPTRLGELRAVCSNCHRMLHRERPVPRVGALRERVAALRAALAA